MGVFILGPLGSVEALNVGVDLLIKYLMRDCWKAQISVFTCVVPCLANSSALRFSHSPLCATIHRSSTVLVVAVFLIAVRQSATVLLRMLFDLIAI